MVGFVVLKRQTPSEYVVYAVISEALRIASDHTVVYHKITGTERYQATGGLFVQICNTVSDRKIQCGD